MSDDFDKEAEREKLRQQFEAEEEAREATQRMSELLLQGATMTNMHCEDCGDPIFRHDGREFCPTCGRTVVDEAAADEVAGDEAGEAGGTARTGSATDGDAAAEVGEPDAAPSPETAGEAVQEEPTATGTAHEATGGVAAPDAPTEAPARRDRPAPSGAGADDLGEARAALIRTLTGLAREAEATDDPRRARDLLAAAHEAAEALAAVESSRR